MTFEERCAILQNNDFTFRLKSSSELLVVSKGSCFKESEALKYFLCSWIFDFKYLYFFTFTEVHFL